jgi:hypothetical protein
MLAMAYDMGRTRDVLSNRLNAVASSLLLAAILIVVWAAGQNGFTAERR